jgi:hypothetical protein
MKQESGPDSGSVDNPHNFYKPIADKNKLNLKISLILDKKVISLNDLFEITADAIKTYQIRMLKRRGFVIEEGKTSNLASKMDPEVSFCDLKTKETVLLEHRTNFSKETGRVEIATIELSSDKLDEVLVEATLNREEDGSINPFVVNEEDASDELENNPDAISDGQMRRVLNIILQGNEFEKDYVFDVPLSEN